MLTNGCIALYHYCENTNSWRRSYFPAVSIFRRFASDVSSGDFSPDNNCVIRVPNHANANVEIGDYVYIGSTQNSEPDLKACLKVTSFVRNNRGRSPHLKIICC